ncbi:MAG: site-2 protease family protein [Chloroflexi bacterium]|nr:site-2 protease family protein [Chloroflexota bacterium]
MFGSGIDLYSLVLGFVVIMLSITVHEASHALMAYRLGDSTAKYLGRLTLNPIAHMDPLGTIMILMTMLGGFGIGWGKPVPVNPHNLRNGPKTGMALVSAVGPISNLALAAALAIPLRFNGVTNPMVADILFFFVTLNVALAAFNIIPLPPLDGFKVLLGILPYRQAYSLSRLENYGPAILLLVIFAGPFVGINILGMLMRPLMNALYWLIMGFPGFGFF